MSMSFWSLGKRFFAVFVLIAVLLSGGCADATEISGTGFTEQSSQMGHDGFDGQAYTTINDNTPEFTGNQKKDTTAFEQYSELDKLGRCGVAFANVCSEIMPNKKRGGISHVKPSGWQTAKYPGVVDGKYLYNRCHLIGYQLAGENANEKNLITGTRYLNVEGMLPFENEVADYVQETGNHVLYRVTPVFDQDNLVADGVQIEAYSVEDAGKGVCFNVFIYNVQPGVSIDYATGDSQLADSGSSGNLAADANDKDKGKASSDSKDSGAGSSDSEVQEYILNTNTRKFHVLSCSSIEDTLAEHKKEYTGTRESLIEDGYSPCGRCHP